MTGYLYFLIYNGSIVRIGQTRDVVRRITEYLTYAYFDDVRVIECSVESICHYESRLIAYFKPVGNNHYNSNKNYHLSMPLRKNRKRKRIWEFEALHKYLIQKAVKRKIDSIEKIKKEIKDFSINESR